jgi:hypothetical protein
MIAVIFEVQPPPGQNEAYLDVAATLRPLLARIDGFISIERFENLTCPGKIVSLVLARLGRGSGMAQRRTTQADSERGQTGHVLRLPAAHCAGNS